MIKLDFDGVAYMRRNRRVPHLKRLQLAQQCLNNLKPCYARVSGSKKGFHVLKLYDGNGCGWIEDVYDDPKRRPINEIRMRYGLTANILFDIKSFRNVTRVAGEWQLINDGYDVERFLDYWRV